MGSPRENQKLVEELIVKVKEHCMCLRFNDCLGLFLVTYPEGFELGGVQCAQSIGKAKALRKILDKMEEHWLESFPK